MKFLKNRRFIPAFLFLLVLSVKICPAQLHSIDLMSGLVVNLKTPLLIQRQGKDNMTFLAEYDTKSFENIPYFMLRLNFQVGRRIIEIQYMHHKLYLSNPQGSVSHFEMSDGFNLLSANYRLALKFIDWRFGLGAVFAYPESVVDGRSFSGQGGLFNSGLYLAGPVLFFGVSKIIALTSDFYLNTELQFTSAWVLVPVATGQAYASNLAFHFLFGGGYRF
jgi:hypothetical protein